MLRPADVCRPPLPVPPEPLPPPLPAPVDAYLLPPASVTDREESCGRSCSGTLTRADAMTAAPWIVAKMRRLRS